MPVVPPRYRGAMARAAHDLLDQRALKDLVSPATLARGVLYAVSGAVLEQTWDASGNEVAGTVQGSSSRPYQVRVTLARDRNAKISDLTGQCSCPVGYNCKHAVALLLASGAGRAAPAGRKARPDPARRQARPRPQPAQPAAWERALGGLVGTEDRTRIARAESGALLRLEGLEQEDDRVPVAVGLSFELADRRQYGRRGDEPPTRPGIRMRPVVPGRRDGWVRTGISWSRLDYYTLCRGSSPETAEAVQLLRELRLLATLGSQRSWYGDEEIWLESIRSRRIWDLLGEAEDLGMPLLRAGRQPLPIQLEREPVEAMLDVAAGDEPSPMVEEAGDTALRVRALLVAGGEEIAIRGALLLGKPAHGVGWWDPDHRVSSATPALRLAPLARPLAGEVASLLEHDPVVVPAEDAPRFFRDLYPRLSELVPVASLDASVALPERAPEELVLELAAEDAHALRWRWSGPLVHTASGVVLGRQARLRAPERSSGGSEPDPVEAARAAVRTVPVVAAAMLAPTPLGEQLCAGGRLEGLAAARFASEVLPELAALTGLRVELVGTLPGFRQLEEAPEVRLAGQESADGDWLDLAVEVTVAGERVPFGELFAALASGEEHLLLPSGGYFSLDRPELRQLAQLIAEARSLEDAPRGELRLSRFQASLFEELSALGTLEADAATWRAAVDALADGLDGEPVPLPTGLVASLRPYQYDGFQWLARRYRHRLGGILADDMGLGKTIQALALIAHVHEQGPAEEPFLVVAPTSVVGNWVREAERFVPGLRTVPVTETAKRRACSLGAHCEGASVVVTSYALFRLEYEEYAAMDWAGLFLDEAQFAKNPLSHANRLARRFPAPFKLAMTGTPLENSLTELWALSAISAPGLFARPERFAETYRTPIERHHDADRLDQLRRRLRPILLRRTKEQVERDLPDKQEQVMELELHPRHRRLYQTYLQRERQKILGLLGDMDRNRFEILRSLTILRQAALDVSLVDSGHAAVPSTKLDALAELLTGIVADGHRVLVFSQFTRFLTAARRRLDDAGIASCYLDGRTRRRAEVVESFRRGDAPAFLISLKAGGFGLNLTEADYCVLLDPWWNPATEAQAIDRVHRIGQTRKVMVYRLVATDTIEDKVMALKARKAKLFASVLGGDGFESAALSAADLRALLAD